MAIMCRAFLMRNAAEASEHIDRNWELVEDYGDRAYGRWLHTWDDGRRMPGRCRACGAMILLQQSEFHSMTSDDSYYTDYFPVADAAGADALNRAYSGFEIETAFTRRWLMQTNGCPGWAGEPLKG